MRTHVENRNPLIRAALLCAAIVSPVALAGPGERADESGVRTLSIVVEYDDLDLTSSEGAKMLYERIRTAARRACGPREARSVHLTIEYEQCYDRAVAEAVAKVDSPALASVHRTTATRGTG